MINTWEVETVKKREVALGAAAFASLHPEVPSSALDRVVTAAEMTIAVVAVPARATAVARRNSCVARDVHINLFELFPCLLI